MQHQYGSRFQKFREDAGLTQGQVAKVLGLSTPQFVSNVERGRSAPALETLPVLAHVYKVPIVKLKTLALHIERDNIEAKTKKAKLTAEKQAALTARLKKAKARDAAKH